MEPKFKAGDILQCENGFQIQVKRINHNQYFCIVTDDSDIHNMTKPGGEYVRSFKNIESDFYKINNAIKKDPRPEWF